jgi:hypothetical protein
MSYKVIEGEIIFIRGRYFRINKISENGSELEPVIPTEEQKAMLSSTPQVTSYHVHYENGHISRPLYNKARARKYAKRKSNVAYIGEYYNGKFLRRV